MEENCESCVKIREERDLLVNKCELQGLQIESLRNKYLEKFKMLYDSKQEIAMLQKMVNSDDKDTEKNNIEANNLMEVNPVEEISENNNLQDGNAPDVESFLEFSMVVPKVEPPDETEVLNSCEEQDEVHDVNTGNERDNVEIKHEEDSQLDLQDNNNPEYSDHKSGSETLQNFNLLLACGNTFYKQETLDVGIVNTDLAADDCRCNECSKELKKMKRVELAKLSVRLKQKGYYQSYQFCGWMLPHEKLGWQSCGLAFRTIAELVDHCKEEHFKGTKKTGFPCYWRRCKRKRVPFTTKKHFMLHFRVHSGQKPFRCSHEGCGRAFSYLQMLTRHQQTHESSEYPCGYPECSQVFPSKSTLMDHRGLRHGERREDWDNTHNLKCTFANCGKICRNSFAYGSHMQRHNAKMPFVCDFPGCKEAFFWKSLLDKHMEKHAAG